MTPHIFDDTDTAFVLLVLGVLTFGIALGYAVSQWVR